MSKSTKSPVAAKSVQVGATVVREWFAANTDKVPAGDKTVGKAPSQHRGRLSQDARKVYTEATGNEYAAEAGVKTLTLPVTKKSSSGATLKRPVEVDLPTFRTLSGQAKGRPSSASIEKAARAFEAQRDAAPVSQTKEAKPTA